MLKLEEKEQFNEILEELGKTLDITESEFNAAVASYDAVGKQLSKDGLLAVYKPEILPQGSFMLGTMIRPINEDDDLDIDLVCNLHGKNSTWTQEILKNKVGEQLQENEIYRTKVKLVNDRFCWTLFYRETAENSSSKYQLDIVPCIIDENYLRMFSEALKNDGDLDNVSELAIRITDKDRLDYPFEANHKVWLKSNPIGYGKWFFNRARISSEKRVMLSEAIRPVPNFQHKKLPLQRVVQILKRHRDIMFEGDENKPISIIITTLAAKAYNKEENIIDALLNVITSMEHYIDEGISSTGKQIKWISNPVNKEENFADNWEQFPEKKVSFYKWLNKVKTDVSELIHKRGIDSIQESMSLSFGDLIVKKSISNYGNNMRLIRESGNLKMASRTGLIGSVGSKIKNHDFHGKK